MWGDNPFVPLAPSAFDARDAQPGRETKRMVVATVPLPASGTLMAFCGTATPIFLQRAQRVLLPPHGGPL